MKEKHPKNQVNLTDLISKKLEKALVEAVNKAYPELKISEVLVEIPKDRDHGDFTTPISLKIAKQIGENPLKIAENIHKNCKTPAQIEKSNILPPGFINFFYSDEYVNHQIADLDKNGEKSLKPTLSQKETIVIDYSSPNIAKPLGVHHLLSTVIGQSLYNIYTFIGYETVSDNHLGDYGTQFGKLIYAYKQWGDKKQIEKDPNNELLNLYVKFHKEVKKDPQLDDLAREEFKKLEEGNKENSDLWEWFLAESLRDLEKTYKNLGVSFDNYLGESFYNGKMEPIIEKGIKEKLFVEGEQGALIYKFKGEETPAVIKKKDGTTLYITRDFATIEHRAKTWNPSKNIYVVDRAQSLHFIQLFEIVSKLFPEYKDMKNYHVDFGRMNFKDKKMSTREGNVLPLEEVLKEAQKRTAELLKTKKEETRIKDFDKAAEQIGISSVKYSILSQNRGTDIVFDWDKILTLEGNSAPYLQYTCARAMSIIRKNEEDLEYVLIDPMDEGSFEYQLAREVAHFKEYLYQSAVEFKPNILATYLYELTQAFNSFYNSVPVLKAQTKGVLKMRLALVKAFSETLRTGMKLLCIDVLEEM